MVTLVFGLLVTSYIADAQHVVFLVRHAEQASGTDADDPR
jgi:hypothetical protein